MTERPRLQVTSVTIGTDLAGDHARFYAELLGYRVTADDPPGPDDGGWAQIKPPEGEAGPTLNFEYERQFVPPTWPAEPGHQNATQHLDVWVQDLDAAVAWAVECGATLAAFQPQPEVRVLIDPRGHPFCLFT